MVTSSLLDQWGLDGFHSHVAEVEDFYRRRRDKMVEAADKHLTGLVEYNVPLGGMFLWLKVEQFKWLLIYGDWPADSKKSTIRPGAWFDVHLGHDHGARPGGEHNVDAWPCLPTGARQTVSIYDDILYIMMIYDDKCYIMMTTGKPCQYLRAAFSIAPEQNFDPAMERLADLIRCGQWTNTF